VIKQKRIQSDLLHNNREGAVKRIQVKQTAIEFKSKKKKWKKSHLDQIKVASLFTTQSLQDYTIGIKKKKFIHQCLLN
jgi:hypothetical protein